MRLSQIKLAGFKSFVEPTTILVPGQLVAVCGPNGCGKSNVIDAVRWVLGESSAKQLRGESMQDVIFNGSDQRKPAARASVELVFDNEQGRASGPWSQYAEIAIKRLLTRSGDSSYYINNQQVRRRDITDLFLGTGVGARGYAVIEQGMISRIIEARPEELRLFLEEAAGVSKYKERRRETETRLKDARDNLLRLDDIREELGQQLEKLTSQAEVAQRYLDLNAKKEHTEQQLTLVRLLDAEREQARWFREGQQSAINFEAAVAGLRALESQLETLREEHFTASDALHHEQGKLYEANARLARLEQQLTHLRESRERLTRQIDQDKRELANNDQQRQSAQGEQSSFALESQRIQDLLLNTEEALLIQQTQLPELEQQHRDEQQRHQQLQQRVFESQRQVERLQTTIVHQTNQLQSLQQRETRLREELRQLASNNSADLARLTEQFQHAETALQQQRQVLDQANEALKQQRQQKTAAEQQALAYREKTSNLKARSDALQGVLQAQGGRKQLAAWLASQHWDTSPALYETVQIESGWETALEAVLADSLSARVLTAMPAAIERLQAPAKVSLLWPATKPKINAQLPLALTPLAEKISAAPELESTISSLLAPYCIAAAGVDFDTARAVLPEGYVLVLPSGHQFEHGRLRLHAAEGEGLLALQAEWNRLQVDLEAAQKEQQVQQQAVQISEQDLQTALAQQQEHERTLKSREHDFQEVRLARARQEELQRVSAARQQGIETELEELLIDGETIAMTRVENEDQLQLLRDEAVINQEQLESNRHLKLEAEVALERLRGALRTAEREQHEAQFQQRLLSQKQADLERRLQQLNEQAEVVRERLESTQLELEMLDPMQFDVEIQAAIDSRGEQEQQLAQARDRLALLSHQLREFEESRLKAEQGLEPLRQGIQQLQLKEQEARLNVERHSELLEGIDRVSLETELGEESRPSQLQAQITRLANAIEALGAVNLAAVEELATASERKNWLDAQANDLTTAIDTLTDAISRIDGETRQRLQATYETVNRNLGELFPTLFGGGRAELVLTGDEILDAGLQIIAQPPGKKNSSITLLSGGEKALTALSLVFALFRLNPAPFCLLDEVDAPLDDANTTRFCDLVKTMSKETQFLYISHNRLTMEMAEQLVGITMQEKGVSRMVAVDVQQAQRMINA